MPEVLPEDGVSIHAFRGEGDRSTGVISGRIDRFQSTPSGGKATDRNLQRLHRRVVSIHAFRGEGDRHLPSASCNLDVSIHAFRGEGDRQARASRAWRMEVSIHAFRGEGDGEGR